MLSSQFSRCQVVAIYFLMLPPEVLSARDFAAVARTPLCHVVIENWCDWIKSEKVADVMLDQQSVGMALRAPRGSKTLAAKVQWCFKRLKDSLF